MLTLQRAVSSPVVQVYANRIEGGSIPPPIAVDKNVIVEGNHRYIAGLLCNTQVPMMPGTAPLSAVPTPISGIMVDTFDWGNR